MASPKHLSRTKPPSEISRTVECPIRVDRGKAGYRLSIRLSGKLIGSSFLRRFEDRFGNPDAAMRFAGIGRGDRLEVRDLVSGALLSVVSEAPRVQVLAWSPEGDRLLLHVVSAGGPGSGDIEQAIGLYEAEAENGNVDAMVRLGEIYWHGDGTKRNRRLGVSWHEKAAKEGRTASLRFVGVRYFEGGYGIVREPELAWKYLNLIWQAMFQLLWEHALSVRLKGIYMISARIWYL